MTTTPVSSSKKIQLINAPLATAFCSGIRAGAYPPLHLASLRAYLRQRCPEIDVEIIDGELIPFEDMLLQLDANLVGISCNSLTYETALKIAESAKRRGAQVVLGGAHPTFAGNHIVQNRRFVDAVVYGEGEMALYLLATGQPLAGIPNLIYRQGERVCVNEEVRLTQDDLPVPDYTGIALEPYFWRYRRLYHERPFKKAFAACSAKGCQWRDRAAGGCVFCAIQHIGFRIKSVSKFWNELIQMRDVWGADFIWDVSDTFTMQREWVRQFADHKPDNLGLKLHVYGRATDIDLEMARLLARIGVYEVLIGLESGSNEILRAARKGTSVHHNLQAVRNLSSEGIRVAASIIIGLPGESESTLAATVGIVEEMLSWDDLTDAVSELNCSILLPLPGSHVLTQLYQKAPPRRGEEDLFDPDALRRAWTENYCKVSYERLIEVQAQILKMHHRGNIFGLTVSEREYQTSLKQARRAETDLLESST